MPGLGSIGGICIGGFEAVEVHIVVRYAKALLRAFRKYLSILEAPMATNAALVALPKTSMAVQVITLTTTDLQAVSPYQVTLTHNRVYNAVLTETLYDL